MNKAPAKTAAKNATPPLQANIDAISPIPLSEDAAEHAHPKNTKEAELGEMATDRIAPSTTKVHSRSDTDMVVPSPAMEACNESTALFHDPSPTALVNPLLQVTIAPPGVEQGEHNDLARESYEEKLRTLDDHTLPKLAPPLQAKQTVPEKIVAANKESTHLEQHKMTHKVLIPKDYTGNASVRFSNGVKFHEIPVGIETDVSDEIHAAMTDSSVPFTSKKL